jgi:MoaA/NifB/PqqE/SkfB family radical SAM enzyme/protein-L-isoaspartate O-methyltransferase
MKGDEFFIKVANRPPFSKLHPAVAGFLKDYLSNEKVRLFNGQYVVNTHFPPFPSPAFDNLVEHFGGVGSVEKRRLYSVTLAVTNRCSYRCWHCYNAGRIQKDIPLNVLREVIHELQEMGAVRVTLTGGEPLKRKDLESIAGAFDEKASLNLNTTGDGLTPGRAAALHENGLFALGVSIDSQNPQEHDRMRGRKGAFTTALRALELAAKNSLYPYVISLATREFLEHERFWAFVRFAADAGAREIHLIEPCATGNLAGRQDVVLKEKERDLIIEYQKELALNDDLPVLSSFLYLESPDAFGCGAGLTHLYIDGSGELCPCNLVPLSFGNIQNEPVGQILERMGKCFTKPRTVCAGRTLSMHIPGTGLPTPLEESVELCKMHLPKRHHIPRFFRTREESMGEAGSDELRSAYDRIHGSYEEFWVCEAGKPVRDLVDRLRYIHVHRVLEAGCGTGYATALLAGKLGKDSELLAVDLSGGMLEEARNRINALGLTNVKFVAGDALELVKSEGLFDLVFSSWVLGYIPLKPFFSAACSALNQGGCLAFIVHRENSPARELGIFYELVAEDPAVLTKRVAFDFPSDINHARKELEAAGFQIEFLQAGDISFRYKSPEEVLDHLLKSGAGTAFYDAIDPRGRERLEKRFLEKLAECNENIGRYDVVHDYITCIAQKR